MARKHYGHAKSVKQLQMAERRAKVARLYSVGGLTKAEVAAKLGVSMETVRGDLRYIQNRYYEEAKSDLIALRAREWQELRLMEMEAGRRYQESKRPVWLRLRLRIKERSARLMGLDEVKRSELTIRPPTELETRLARLSLPEIRTLIAVASTAPENFLPGAEEVAGESNDD